MPIVSSDVKHMFSCGVPNLELENTFHKDLERGKQIEYKYLSMIRRKYPDAMGIEGYCKEYDIFIPSLNFGVEVKSDYKSKYTGNIVVEIAFDGKPSNLATTKAKYWIWDLGDKTLLVRVDELKNVVKDLKTVKFTARGDFKQKEAYLVKKHLIEAISLDRNILGLD